MNWTFASDFNLNSRNFARSPFTENIKVGKAFHFKPRKALNRIETRKCRQQTVYPIVYLEGELRVNFILFFDYFGDKVHFLSVHKFSFLMLSHERYEVDKRHTGCLPKLNISEKRTVKINGSLRHKCDAR